MKVKEVLEKMEAIGTADGRGNLLRPLMKVLSPVSIKVLNVLQDLWDGERSFDDFVKVQNETIKMCVANEISPLGQAVREEFKMPHLTMDTEVESIANEEVSTGARQPQV